MSPNDNIETVKKLYEAFGEGDVDTILSNLADDVDWSVEAKSDAAPWWGRRSGKDETGKFFADLAGAVDVQEFTPLSFTAGDDEVMVLIRFRFTVKATGKEATMNIHHYWRLEDGKVAQWRGAEDSLQTSEALAG